jgi:thioredoxin-dependent peroxiredoxin
MRTIAIAVACCCLLLAGAIGGQEVTPATSPTPENDAWNDLEEFLSSSLTYNSAGKVVQTTQNTKSAPNVGDSAPDFTLQDQDGKKMSLHDFRGQNVLIMFYVSSFLPEAKQQLLALQNGTEQWTSNPKVLAVSVDSVPVNHTFADALNLKFSLLSDNEKKVHSRYGAYAAGSGVTPLSHKQALAVWLVSPSGRVLAEQKGEAALNLSALSEKLKANEPSPK